MSKAKLFGEMSDEVVEATADAWASLGEFFAINITDAKIFPKLERSQSRKICDKVLQLVDNPYKNRRLELKRWRELYERFKSLLLANRRKFCDDGKKELERAQCLYSGKNLERTYRIVPTDVVTLTFPAYMGKSELRDQTEIYVKMNGKFVKMLYTLEELGD